MISGKEGQVEKNQERIRYTGTSGKPTVKVRLRNRWLVGRKGKVKEQIASSVQ